MSFGVEAEDLREHGLAIIDVADPSCAGMLTLRRQSEPTSSSPRVRAAHP